MPAKAAVPPLVTGRVSLLQFAAVPISVHVPLVPPSQVTDAALAACIVGNAAAITAAGSRRQGFKRLEMGPTRIEVGREVLRMFMGRQRLLDWVSVRVDRFRRRKFMGNQWKFWVGMRRFSVLLETGVLGTVL